MIHLLVYAMSNLIYSLKSNEIRKIRVLDLSSDVMSGCCTITTVLLVNKVIIHTKFLGIFIITTPFM
jgi:hypothetical protein